MTCNCLPEIKEAVSREVGDPDTEFDTVYMGGISSPGLLRPQPLRFSYRDKKKNGDYYKNRKKSFVQFIFCPFCGTRYHEKEDA